MGTARDGAVPARAPLVARCEITHTGRLTAVLPEATLLLLLEPDGSVLVCSDAGGFELENRG